MSNLEQLEADRETASIDKSDLFDFYNHGWDALTAEIQRLRARVAVLEESLDDTCEQCDGACPHRKEQSE